MPPYKPCSEAERAESTRSGEAAKEGTAERLSEAH